MNVEEIRDYCLSLGRSAPDSLLRDLTRNSYETVKAKYTKKTNE